MSSSQPAAVVLGLGQNGLATVRALGRAGVPVYGIDGDCQQATAQSRYCTPIVCPGFREGGAALLRVLEDLGKTLPERAVLFPSGDMSVALVSEHRDQLSRYFRFRLPDRDTIRLVLDKGAFQRFGEKHGIALPRTVAVRPDIDLDKTAASLRFPCIIKPLQPNAAWRQQFRDRKLFECADARTLTSTLTWLRGLHTDLLIQEIIPGSEDNLEFSLTYLDGHGQPLGMFTGRKLRQFPPDFGTSCLAESYHSTDVADLTLTILHMLNYQGYGSVEFKRHPADGQLRVIEVTPRTWFPHGLATACGVNLPLIAYREQVGLPVPPVGPIPQGIRWIHEERDLRVAWAAWRQGRLTLADWWRSYQGQRTYAIAALDDPAPILALGRRVLGAGLRKLHRSVRGTAPAVQTSAPLTNRKDAA